MGITLQATSRQQADFIRESRSAEAPTALAALQAELSHVAADVASLLQQLQDDGGPRVGALCIAPSE